MVVQHNLSAANTNRQLQINTGAQAKSAEKLSSGYRINRAADDAAGLSISEKLRHQIRGLTQGVSNTEDGVSVCQVADGALAEVTDMLHRITELSVQAANDTNTDSDRQAIQKEIHELIQEIDRIGGDDRVQYDAGISWRQCDKCWWNDDKIACDGKLCSWWERSCQGE